MEKPESKMKEHRVHGISSRIDSMSPQGISHARRDRLKTRCLERIKERRSHLIDAFRQGTARVCNSRQYDKDNIKKTIIRITWMFLFKKKKKTMKYPR